MSFDFLNKKKKVREAEEKARKEEDERKRITEIEKARIAEEEQARLAEEERKKKQEHARIEAARKCDILENEIRTLKNEIYRNNDRLTRDANEIDHVIKAYCGGNSLTLYINDSPTDIYYTSMCIYLDNGITKMQNSLSKIKEANNLLAQKQDALSRIKISNDIFVPESYLENMDSVVSQAESNVFSQIKKKAEDCKSFLERTHSFPSSKMMIPGFYGKIDKDYWDAVCGMTREEVVGYISTCYEHINKVRGVETDARNVDGIYTIDVEKVLRCVWFFAIEKPFSAGDFSRACYVFDSIYHGGSKEEIRPNRADCIIAELYAIKGMGDETSLCRAVQKAIAHLDFYNTGLVASSLFWMNAYLPENMVLQHMLTEGKPMTATMQKRLHALINCEDNTPRGFDVKSSEDAFYFDISALAWRDDEYVGLFENLAFKDKPLTYSLAIREENKELFIPQGINIPGTAGIANKINSVFFEEYGNGVKVRSVNCIALSGSGEEKLEGVLVSPGDCKQMGILMYMARIGKKLIIRFYTLFVPAESDLVAQKQQALSLYKKLSPSVAMWESSLKDTMLMAVEQLLNSSVQGNDTPTTNPFDEIGNEPIF